MPKNPSRDLNVRCPTCGKMAPFTPKNAYRPFCSKRCKLIDLGQWANEEYRFPDATAPNANDEPGD